MLVLKLVLRMIFKVPPWLLAWTRQSSYRAYIGKRIHYVGLLLNLSNHIFGPLLPCELPSNLHVNLLTSHLFATNYDDKAFRMEKINKISHFQAITRKLTTHILLISLPPDATTNKRKKTLHITDNHAQVSKSSHISILYTNVSGLWSNINELSKSIKLVSPGVIAITELWELAELNDVKLSIGGNKLITKDRHDSRVGSEFAVMFTKSIPYVLHSLPETLFSDDLAYDVNSKDLPVFSAVSPTSLFSLCRQEFAHYADFITFDLFNRIILVSDTKRKPSLILSHRPLN